MKCLLKEVIGVIKWVLNLGGQCSGDNYMFYGRDRRMVGVKRLQGKSNRKSKRAREHESIFTCSAIMV